MHVPKSSSSEFSTKASEELSPQSRGEAAVPPQVKEVRNVFSWCQKPWQKLSSKVLTYSTKERILVGQKNRYNSMPSKNRNCRNWKAPLPFISCCWLCSHKKKCDWSWGFSSGCTGRMWSVPQHILFPITAPLQSLDSARRQCFISVDRSSTVLWAHTESVLPRSNHHCTGIREEHLQICLWDTAQC